MSVDSSPTDLTLQRTAAQRRKMLAIATPLFLLGCIAFWGGAFGRGGVLVVIAGSLLLAPMLLVLDQGWAIVRLTPSGFTIRHAGATSTVPWDEVERFSTRTVPGLFSNGKVFTTSKVINVQFRERTANSPKSRGALTGYLSSVGMDTDAEVELLESWRRRWSRRELQAS
jgi:hypothetical protein